MYLKMEKFQIIGKLNNQKEMKIEVKDLLKVFPTQQTYFITQKKNTSLLQSIDLKSLSLYDKKRDFSNLQITVLLNSEIFTQLDYCSLSFNKQLESFFCNTQLVQKIFKKWFCNKLKFFYFISFFQKQQIFNYFFELSLFQFFDKTFQKEFVIKFKSFSNFIQINKRKKVISKFLNKQSRTNPVLTNDSLVKSQKYSDLSTLEFFNLNTSYIDLYRKSFHYYLFSLVGLYWSEESFRVTKSLSSNSVIRTGNSRNKLKTVQMDKFKTKYNNIIKSHSQKSLQYLINYYLFEFKKKIYKIKNYSTVKNFALFETSLFDTESLKIEIFLKLFPLFLQVMLKNQFDLFFFLDKTEFFSRKNNRLEFYCLKQIFNLFYYFYFQHLLSKSTRCINLQNFCHKMIQNNFSQSSNSINREFYYQFKKNTFYLLSLNTFQRGFHLMNFEQNSKQNFYFLCFGKNDFDYLNRQNLKFLSVEPTILNSSSYRKVMYLNKTILSQANNLLKSIDFNSKNYTNINIFLSLSKRNFKNYLETEIQKILFDSLKKINLWVSKSFFTKKIRVLLENPILKSFYKKINKKEEKAIFLTKKNRDWVKIQRYLSQKFFKNTDFIQQNCYAFISQKKRLTSSFSYKNSFLFQCFISILNSETQLLICVNSPNFHVEKLKNFRTEFKNWYFNYSERVIKFEYFFSKVLFPKKNGQDNFRKSEFQKNEEKENRYKQIKFDDFEQNNSTNITIFHQGSSIFFVNNGSFFISPTQLNVLLYLKMLKKIIKKSSTKTQEILIIKLSAKIYAWCYHYKNILNKKVLNYFDYRLLTFLWRWACRRHNNKSKKWIKSKYFYKFNDKNWVFGNFFSNSFGSQSLNRNSLVLIYLPFHSQIFFHLKKLV